MPEERNGQKLTKIPVSRTVLVEGRYDKIKLESIVDAEILTTEGFGIFKQEEKKALLRAAAAKNGLIVLTDSDGAGLVIRNYVNGIVPKENVVHLYVPKIAGKEKRKATPSKEGTLGVEGMNADLLRDLFEPFRADSAAFEARKAERISKTDLFADGFSGADGAEARRRALGLALGLPDNISANALIEAINLLGGKAVYEKAKSEMDKGVSDK